MLLTEWNWDDAKEVWQEEAFEAGEIKGRKEGRQEGLLEGEVIGRQSGLIEGRQSGLKDGEIKGRKESKKDFALALLQDGTFSREKIAEMTKLELAEVEEMALQLDKTK